MATIPGGPAPGRLVAIEMTKERLGVMLGPRVLEPLCGLAVA